MGWLREIAQNPKPSFRRSVEQTSFFMPPRGKDTTPASRSTKTALGMRQESPRNAEWTASFWSRQFVDPVANKSSLVRKFLNTVNTGLFRSEGMMDFKFQGENHLRRRCCSTTTSTTMKYTIVRPGRLRDGPPRSSGKMIVGQTNGAFDGGVGGGNGNDKNSVHHCRADVARVCVAAAFSASAENTTFEVACRNSESPQTSLDDLSNLFDGLAKDERKE